MISDFDYTMTQFYASPGKRGASCHCLIENCGFLPTTYRTQAKALFHYYYPLEVSSSLTVKEKVPHMEEWVEKAHDLLLLSNLRQTQIKYAVAEALSEESIVLRGGVTDLLARLQQQQVPLLLFSAGGCDVMTAKSIWTIFLINAFLLPIDGTRPGGCDRRDPQAAVRGGPRSRPKQ